MSKSARVGHFGTTHLSVSGGHDLVQRARLLPRRQFRHPAGEPGQDRPGQDSEQVPGVSLKLLFFVTDPLTREARSV